MSDKTLTTVTAEKLMAECLKGCGTREQLIDRLHWAGVGINTVFAGLSIVDANESWAKVHEGLADEIARLSRAQKLPINN